MTGSLRVGVATLLAAALIPTSALPAQTVPEVQSVLTMSDGGTIIVVIEANGPLPMPVPGFVENPPRMFFDFQGVTPKRKGMLAQPGYGVVQQTRVALYATNVTRVVLDLTRIENYRIDRDERDASRIKIVLGPQVSPGESIPSGSVMPPIEHLLQPGVGSPMQPQPVPVDRPADPAPPVFVPPPPMPSAVPPPAPFAAVPIPAPAAPTAPASAPPPPVATSPPPAPSTPAPPMAADPAAGRQRPQYTPPPSAPKPPSREVERYRQRLSGAVERMEAQQPIVTLLDAEGSISLEALQAALNEFTAVKRFLEGIQPSEPMASAHDMLLASCTLGATATRLGMEASRDNNAETRKNAASAAAGTLMFFDRACADLGCGRPQQ